MSTKPGTELVTIPFHGDTLEATKDGDAIWVSLRRMCESLGVSTQGQLARLRQSGWASVKEIFMLRSHNRAGVFVMLHLDSVPMWLATIQQNKVKPATREKLVAYQKECARVLRDHFLRREVPVARLMPWNERIKGLLSTHDREMNLRFNQKGQGRFSVITATVTSFLQFEDVLFEHCLPTKFTDRPDGSVGSCWANYRRKHGMPPIPPRFYIPVEFNNNGVMQTISVTTYHESEFGAFKHWFLQVYCPEKLPEYLVNKFGKTYTTLPPASASFHICKTIGAPKPLLRKKDYAILQGCNFQIVKANDPIELTTPNNLFKSLEAAK